MRADDPTDLIARGAADDEEDRIGRAHRIRELEDLTWLMEHQQGRRIVARLLEQTGVFRSSFDHSGSRMAFNEGRRDTGIWLTAELAEASINGYFKMLKEFQSNDD